jgi:class 3 adenylate cyclase/ligand-binding sensor domain-containing protein
LASCNQPQKEDKFKLNVSVTKVNGIVIKDSTTPPKVIRIKPENAPEIVPAGEPKITLLPKSKVPGDAFFTQYTEEDGLLSMITSKIIEDRNGNLWISVFHEGWTKFDGSNFIHYTTVNGMQNPWPTCLAEDKTGNIWSPVGEGWVTKYDGIRFTNYFSIDDELLDFPHDLMIDENDRIWFATENGLLKYEVDKKWGTEKMTRYTTENGLKGNFITLLEEDLNGHIWIGSDNFGLTKFDPDSNTEFTNYTTEDGLSSNKIQAIEVDNHGNIWIGTDKGLHKYNGDHFTHYTTNDGLTNNDVQCIKTDSKGNIWIGTRRGLSRFEFLEDEVENIVKYISDESLINASVADIIEDKRGIIWIGTFGSGLFSYNPSNPTHFNYGRLLLQDNENNLWFRKFGSGVTKFDGKQSMTYGTAQGLATNNVYKIFQDKDDYYWFAGNNTLSKFDGKTFTKFNLEQSLPGMRVMEWEIDSNDNIWGGSWNDGVVKFDGDSFTHYTSAQGLSKNTGYRLLADKTGNIWMGGEHLNKFDGQYFTNYAPSNLSEMYQSEPLVEDRYGNIWFGSLKGLVRFDGENLTRYTTDHGLSTNNLVMTETVEDPIHDLLWVNTKRGVSALKLSSIHSVEPDSLSFQNYNSNTDYIERVDFVDNKGIIWGYGKEEIVRMDIDTKVNQIKDFDIRILNVGINNEKVSWYLMNQNPSPNDSLAALNEMAETFGKILTPPQQIQLKRKYHDIQFDSISRYYPVPQNLILPYSKNSISFEFVAIDLAKGKEIEYQFILEGYDKQWSALGKKTIADFGNIDEGNYTFRIRAVNPHGIWSEQHFDFEVLSPWWRTWWALALYVLGALFSIYSFVQWRTSKLKKQQKKLEQIVTDRTAEVVAQKDELVKQNVIITTEKKRSEELLLNILPSETAEELKQYGSAKARNYDTVTVLFTDFQGFSYHAEKLTPEQLVAKIDHCFKAFDQIMDEYNIEKIKTIGDAYMAAAGLPKTNTSNPVDAVRAGLKIRDFMLQSKEESKAKGQEPFEIRIGIHTGPVVAGIVGIKKFAYDIWGDTVNLASRMESSGEIGKVNISQNTYELLKDRQEFTFVSRGKIKAKNKGEIEMYFVEYR